MDGFSVADSYWAWMGAGFSEYDKSDFDWGDLVPTDTDRVANVWSICSTILVVVSRRSVTAFFWV